MHKQYMDSVKLMVTEHKGFQHEMIQLWRDNPKHPSARHVFFYLAFMVHRMRKDKLGKIQNIPPLTCDAGWTANLPYVMEFIDLMNANKDRSVKWCYTAFRWRFHAYCAKVQMQELGYKFTTLPKDISGHHTIKDFIDFCTICKDEGVPFKDASIKDVTMQWVSRGKTLKMEKTVHRFVLNISDFISLFRINEPSSLESRSWKQ